MSYQMMQKFIDSLYIQKYLRLKTFCIFVVFSVLLTPSIPIASGIPSLRLDDILLIMAPILVMLLVGRIVVDARVGLLLLIGFLIEVSIAVGAVKGYPASMADHFYVFRILKYIGAATLGATFAYLERENGTSLKWLAKVIVLTGFGLIFLVFQQFFDLLNLNAFYVQFVAPTQYETLINDYSWPRPVGMVGNPNELSFLLGIISALGIWLYLSEPKQNLLWLMSAMLYLLTCFLTLSRSGVFATAIMISVLLIGSIVKGLHGRERTVTLEKRKTTRFLLLSGIGATGVAAALFINPIFKKLTWRFTPEYFGGWYKRIEHWQENLNYWLDSPLFGIGPLRHSGIFKYAADNEWLLLLRTGGVFLALTIIALFFLDIFLSKKTNDMCGCLSFSLAVGASAYMVPAAFFYSLVIMPMAIMLLVLLTPIPVVIIRSKLKPESVNAQ
jgi:hypothetical protein